MSQPSPQAFPPGWYPDPFGRHESRWWDGGRWSEHVSSHGRQGTDAPTGASPVPTMTRSTDKIARDVARAGVAPAPFAAPAGTGSLLTESILVFNQKAKLKEINTEYTIFDQNGGQLGAVRQVGQSAAKKAVRLLSNSAQFMTHKFQMVDNHGQVVMAMTRPATMLKSRIIVQNGAGAEVGAIVQQTYAGKRTFALESGGQAWGSISSESMWTTWDFGIADHTGAEIARVTRTWQGLAKAAFTTADNYVLHIHRPLQDPLRSLVLASAVGLDVALRQQGYRRI